jgi:hypothetical protein
VEPFFYDETDNNRVSRQSLPERLLESDGFILQPKKTVVVQDISGQNDCKDEGN